MDVLNEMLSGGMLHALSQGLRIPVVLALVVLVAYALYQLGSLVVELVVERRAYTMVLPRTIDALDVAPVGRIDQVIEESGMLRTQKDVLLELSRHMQLPPDALNSIAKRLFADEQERYEKAVSLTDTIAKVAPMVGLMGTLIPLGPGIVGLSSGDLETLSSSLLMAFDTTVAGLLVAIVCMLIVNVRRRWYSGYLVSLEGCIDTILEKAELAHAVTEQATMMPNNKGEETDYASEQNER